MKDFAHIEVTTRSALRRWLSKNHAQSESIWLVTYKKSAGAKYLPYEAIVEEALCFGWVDSLPRALDADRSMRLLSPRKPRSAWSAKNKARVASLLRNGLMHSSGLRVVEAAKRDGSWRRLDAVEALKTPFDLARALRAKPKALANFSKFPRSTRRAILEWIESAKAPETRARRIAETAARAAENVRANQYRLLKTRKS